ncbi:mucin-19 isoform X2 [Bombus terrestris]|uniref:Mucin-19 isoform X2 n=1 Tax=Bombus terrestris TaxID=30195 RepID=A0A9C6W073_BOMTE|nr:mucin-19 isoform X2 [Bombus terrestris]
MRPILVILIFFSGSVLSRYYEKKRFDRSIYDDFEIPNVGKHLIKKQWTFTDYETHFSAYKDREENNCYIEKLEDNIAAEGLSENGIEQKQTSKVLYAPNEFLTKLEAWQIAGARIVDFCNGHKIILLQKTIPIFEQTIDPFFNILPMDENDIVTRRVADILLTPLISRAKRQVALEERHKNFKQNRLRRQVQPSPGKFRGQTQSQYLSIGNNEQKEGKAEAEATQQSSRAVVTGSNGMGQAQSMSLGSSGCEDCSKYTGENVPDRYVQIPAIKQPGDNTVGQSGMITPGMGATYPSKIPASTVRDHMPYLSGGAMYPGRILDTATGSDASYPTRVGGTIYSGNIPSTTIDGRVVHSGSVPGGTVPGTTTAGGVAYPGGVPGTITGPPRTTTGGGIAYSGGIPTTTTGGGIAYPGNIPTTTTGGGVAYPGNIPTTTTGGGTVYPGGVPSTTITGSTVYPGGVPSTITGGDVAYPGDVPSTTITGTVYPGGVSSDGAAYPGSMPGTTIGGGVTYPGSIPSTTTGGGIAYSGSIPGITTGGGVTYPRGVPGTITGADAVHPEGVPGATTGLSITYPGGVPGTVTGGDVVHPKSAPGTTTGRGVTYPGGVPGTVTGGGVVNPKSAPGTTTGHGVAYPGGVPRTLTGGSTVYPGGVSGITTGGHVAYPGGVAATTIGGNVAYPGGVPSTTTGGGVTYPGGVLGTTTGDGAVYPGGLPGTATAGGITYPGIISGTTTGSGIAYPGGVPGTTTSDDVTYPGVPGTVTSGSVPYPSGVYTSGTVPDTRDTLHGQIITDSKAIGDANVYPGGQSPRQFFGTSGTPRTFPGRPTDVTGVYGGGISPPVSQLGETVHYPGNVIPGKKINGGIIPKISVTAPSGDITYSTGTAPGTSNLDGTRDSFQGKYSENRAIIPPSYPLQGQYPGSSRWQDKGALTSSLVGHGQYPIEQYPGEGQGIKQYPGSIQYPSNIRSITNTGEIPQYYQQPSNLLPVESDNSNSQASSSVKQTDSGTQASASAQGKFQQGTAQSQVTGTYSGTGSFSAQAGSTDINKSAQAEINGGKEGAVSNAQGVGGYGKSQTQVQLNSELGATTTGAQSSGWNHGTNSQVQASSKGGMADAQANGEGSTSSQAQIGFQPYLKTDEKIERYSKPFRGGGTASAQSGAYTGQSQSQLEGSFQYGITYTGAAQAGSGSGAATSRKPFNFNLTDSELFKPFKPSYGPQIVQKNSSERINTASDNEYNQDKLQSGLQTSSSFQRRTFTKPDDNSRNITSKTDQSVEKSQLDDSVYDYEEEYNGEDYDMSSFQTSMNPKISKSYAAEQNNSNYQLQTLHIAAGNQYDVHVKQDTNAPQVGDVLQPGQSLQSRYTIPPGFRGRVTSVAGDKIITHGDGKSQSQTVSLIPKEPNITYENKSPISEIRSLKTNHERLIESYAASKEKQKNTFPQIQYQTSTEYPKFNSNVPMKPSYYTITNSIAGKLDGRNSPRKYEHRYYTKSSTCGYFTFSCNIVYGSNGRTKICKPKMPTYPDGTPMKC